MVQNIVTDPNDDYMAFIRLPIVISDSIQAAGMASGPTRCAENQLQTGSTIENAFAFEKIIALSDLLQ
jgi:hypothetical protein